MPLENDMRLRMNIVGRPLEGAYHVMASWRSVSTGYFDALKIPVLRGRQFTDQDRLGTTGVVIVNQTMARQLWPASDPLSDSIQIGKGLGPNFAVEPTAASSGSSATCVTPRWTPPRGRRSTCRLRSCRIR